MPNYSPDRLRPGVSWATLVCEDGWPPGASLKHPGNKKAAQNNKLEPIICLTHALPATRMEFPALRAYTGKIFPDSPGVLLPEGIQAQQLAFGPPHLRAVTADKLVKTFVRPEVIIGYDTNTGDVTPTTTRKIPATTGMHPTDLTTTTLFFAGQKIDLATAVRDPRTMNNQKKHLRPGKLYPQLVKLKR